MLEAPKQFEVKRDGDKFYIVNVHTGWTSQFFELSDLRVHKAGMDQSMRFVFDLKLVVR